MSKVQTLRDQSEEELDLQLETLYKEVIDLRGQRQDSKAQKTHIIGQKRKEIARILTIKKEREHAKR
ncbi:MAG: 50S ribosomal protein L29 [Chlamydiales bacterium]